MRINNSSTTTGITLQLPVSKKEIDASLILLWRSYNGLAYMGWQNGR